MLLEIRLTLKKERELKSTHVVPNKNEGWSVKTSGSDMPIATFNTKKEAISHGRQVSRMTNSELFIHNKDGKIASRDSHGNDPHPPLG